MKRKLKFLSLLLALNMAAPYSYNLTRFYTGMSLQAYAAQTQSVSESTSSPQAQSTAEQTGAESTSTPEAVSESTAADESVSTSTPAESESTSAPAESVAQPSAEPEAPKAESESTAASDTTDSNTNSLPTTAAEETAPAALANAADSKALEDGINDAWTADNVIAGNSTVCAVENGWLHIKSGTENGNNPGTKPAMFVNPNTFDFS